MAVRHAGFNDIGLIALPGGSLRIGTRVTAGARGRSLRTLPAVPRYYGTVPRHACARMTGTAIAARRCHQCCAAAYLPAVLPVPAVVL